MFGKTKPPAITLSRNQWTTSPSIHPMLGQTMSLPVQSPQPIHQVEAPNGRQLQLSATSTVGSTLCLLTPLLLPGGGDILANTCLSNGGRNGHGYVIIDKLFNSPIKPVHIVRTPTKPRVHPLEPVRVSHSPLPWPQVSAEISSPPTTIHPTASTRHIRYRKRVYFC